MISKLETSFQATNDRYISLFETNVIKTIEQVNHLTDQLQKTDRSSHEKYESLGLKIQELQKQVAKNVEKENSAVLQRSVSKEVMGVSLPNLRLVQSVCVREEKKKYGLNNFKEHIKEQHKETVPLSDSTSSNFNS